MISNKDPLAHVWAGGSVVINHLSLVTKSST